MEKAINADSELMDFMALLSTTTEKDFSGYTEFETLPPEIKIKWIEEAAQFITEAINR